MDAQTINRLVREVIEEMENSAPSYTGTPVSGRVLAGWRRKLKWIENETASTANTDTAPDTGASFAA